MSSPHLPLAPQGEDLVYYSYERANVRAPERRRKRARAAIVGGVLAVCMGMARAAGWIHEAGIGFGVFCAACMLVSVAIAVGAVFFESPPPGDDFVVLRRD